MVEAFRVGDRIALQGLSKDELNGQRGSVIAPFQEHLGRWPVELDQGQRKLSVKPENLVRLYEASAAKPQKDPVDFDDMPPLEFVGVDPEKRYSLREGDRVVLRGLSKAELNGRYGTLLPFMGVIKDRLPVELEGPDKQKLSIKPENLEKVSGAAAAMPRASREQSGFGGAAPAGGKISGSTTIHTAAPKPSEEEEEDLPPLEEDAGPPIVYTNRPKPATTSSLAPKNTRTAAQLSKAVNSPGPARPAKAAAEEDDMPPLVHMGTAAPAKTAEDDDDEMPPLSYAGAPAQALGTGASAALEEDEDDMPPLDYVGSAAPSTSRPQPPAEEDELPPLVYVGTAAPTASTKAPAKVEDDDDDELPPLENFGAKPAAPSQRPPPASILTMPPMQPINGRAEHRAPLNGSSLNGAGRATEDYSDMPPLVYIGTSAAAAHAPAPAHKAAEPPQKAPEPRRPAPVAEAPASPPAARQVKDTVLEEPQLQPREVLKKWCEELQLPGELVERLLEEDVTDPQELTSVSETDLQSLATGLKIGPKGRFMKAIQRMKALEQAEFGSVCSR